jgi:ABC-type transport system involved in cytochrome bd biosynthesis fused ATPase/permease subunit
VGIARALLMDAPVVLLDEPTVGLDVTAEELVVQALTRLVEGRTVIMTTHQPALTRLATRTVHLHRGGVLDEAPVDCELCSGDPLPTPTPLPTPSALPAQQQPAEGALTPGARG